MPYGLKDIKVSFTQITDLTASLKILDIGGREGASDIIYKCTSIIHIKFQPSNSIIKDLKNFEFSTFFENRKS